MILGGHIRERRMWGYRGRRASSCHQHAGPQKCKSGFAAKKKQKAPCTRFIRHDEAGAIPARSGSGWPSTWSDGSDRSARGVGLEIYEGCIRREIAPVIGGLEIATIRPATSAPF